MSDVEHRESLRTTSAAAGRFIYDTLAGHGFEPLEEDAGHFELPWRFRGPGLNSTRQDPLRGASQVEVQISDHEIGLTAELGSVARMESFLRWFPLTLGLGLGLLLGIVLGLTIGPAWGVGFGVPGLQGWVWMIVMLGGGLLPVAPWAFLAPVFGRAFRKKAELALVQLARNAARAPD